MWQHKFGSTLAQVMAFCLTAPNHYLNQCWLIIKDVLWHSPQSSQELPMNLIHNMFLEIILLQLTPHLPGGANELIPWKASFNFFQDWEFWIAPDSGPVSSRATSGISGKWEASSENGIHGKVSWYDRTKLNHLNYRLSIYPLPDGPGEVKLLVGQGDFGKVFLKILYYLFWKNTQFLKG